MFHTILVNPLFNLLVLIYALLPGHDFGVAVIVMTIIIRLVVWPLVNKQLHSQKAMQELQPEVAKIKVKAKGDRQKETQMLMELYKEKEISPFASLLPLLIQLPVFIALYAVLREIVVAGQIAKLTYEPLRHLGVIKSILADSKVFKPTLYGLVDLTKPSLVLAIVAALSQFWQTKQIMPATPTPGSPNLNFAIYMFPLLTLVIALRLPSALALYWAVTSLMAILQQQLVLKRDAEEMEEEDEKKDKTSVRS